MRNGGELSRGEVAVPGYLAQQYDLLPGDPIILRKDGVELTLKVAPRAITDDGSLVVLRPDLEKLDPDSVVAAVWAKFAADAVPNEVLAAVNPAVAPFPGVDVSGAGVERAATAELLGTLIGVALALVAVAVHHRFGAVTLRCNLTLMTSPKA